MMSTPATGEYNGMGFRPQEEDWNRAPGNTSGWR
jgi:hypothetical protein